MSDEKQNTPAAGRGKMKENNGKRPVLVTTAHRGVFFGYASETGGDRIHLDRARLVVYWPPETRGFMGLAAHGPGSGSRIGPTADIEVRGVTSVTEVTPKAAERFEAAPWG